MYTFSVVLFFLHFISGSAVDVALADQLREVSRKANEELCKQRQEEAEKVQAKWNATREALMEHIERECTEAAPKGKYEITVHVYDLMKQPGYGAPVEWRKGYFDKDFEAADRFRFAAAHMTDALVEELKGLGFKCAISKDLRGYDTILTVSWK